MPAFRAHFLFDGKNLHRDAAVWFSESGEVIRLSSGEETQDLPLLPGLLCPALVNTHTHLELSHLAGAIPKGLGLAGFLQSVVKQRGQHDIHEIQESARKALFSLHPSGTGAVGDICNTLHTAALSAETPMHLHRFVEVFGLDPKTLPERLQQATETCNAFAASGPASVVPHAPYSVSEELFALIDACVPGSPRCIHNQECAAEDELFLQGTGALLPIRHLLYPEHPTLINSERSLQRTLRCLPETKHLMLVHNTCSTAEDLALARRSEKAIFWCLCPQANLYIENRLPDADLLYREQCCITLGTDSLASNDALNLWSELHVLHEHFPQIPVEEKLRWATLNGAKALAMDTVLGSLERGKKPGLIHLPGFIAEEPFPEDPVVEWLVSVRP
jgi:cytosine/adenosine deaminase-related metal-dependent hydrolase